jgi:hypothetical protein
MNIQLTGHHNYNGSGANGPVGGRAMDISPDGTRAVVLGDFKDANGALHDQIVMIDLNGSSATIDPNWNTNEFSGAWGLHPGVDHDGFAAGQRLRGRPAADVQQHQRPLPGGRRRPGAVRDGQRAGLAGGPIRQ